MQTLKRSAPHFVTGHRNPDTDALVSAHTAAWLQRQIEADCGAVPVRLGEAGPQALWLFEKAGVPLPTLRTCCRYWAHELAHSVPVVSPDTPLSSVLSAIQKKRSPFAAVCSEQGLLLGTVSDRNQRCSLLLQCNVEDFLGTLLDFNHLVTGLPLEALGKKSAQSIKRIEVILHKHSFQGGWDEETAIIIGDRDLLLETIETHPPGAVIFTGVSHERVLDATSRLKCPCYLFEGSVIQLCSRLSGCFPASAAMEDAFASVEAKEDALEVERLLRKHPEGLAVLDNEGKLLGAITAQTLIEAPAPKLTLVDHSEFSQSIEGLEDAEIVAIFDHHRLGDVESIAPLEMDVRPVGATATLLYQRIQAAGIQIPLDIATLLMGAIISDTLLLVSPTTTPHDRVALEELSQLTGLDAVEFGRQVLRTNDHLASADAADLVQRDCKLFKAEGTAFLAAQIETVDLALLTSSRAQALKAAMLAQVQFHNSAFGVLMVTDVLQSLSLLCVVEPTPHWSKRLQPQSGMESTGFWPMPTMVSRKKQLLPWILKALRG